MRAAPRSRCRRRSTSCSRPPNSTSGRCARPCTNATRPLGHRHAGAARGLPRRRAGSRPTSCRRCSRKPRRWRGWRVRAARERRPDVVALIDAATARGVCHMLDETALTLGAGAGSQTWTLDALPSVDAVPWPALRTIPIAAVTGSNGKTTTVRLLAACARAHGWRDGFNCTDGVFIGARVRGDGRLLRPGRHPARAARCHGRGRRARDGARRHPAPRPRDRPRRRRDRHQHQPRSLRRVRHRRSRRAWPTSSSASRTWSTTAGCWC